MKEMFSAFVKEEIISKEQLVCVSQGNIFCLCEGSITVRMAVYMSKECFLPV